MKRIGSMAAGILAAGALGVTACGTSSIAAPPNAASPSHNSSPAPQGSSSSSVPPGQPSARPSPSPTRQGPSGAQPENPSPSPSSPDHSQPPLLNAGGFNGVQPSTIDVGQDGNIITGITWSEWDSAQAVGTGTQGASLGACNTVNNDPTNPACQPVPVTITLTGIDQNNDYTMIIELANADSPFGSAGSSINAQYGPSVSTFIQSASQ
jgi:hypothetical protein